MNVRPPLTVARSCRCRPDVAKTTTIYNSSSGSSDGGTETARSGYGPAIIWGPAEPRAAFDCRQTATAASSCAGAAGDVCFTGGAPHLQAVPRQGSTSPAGGPAQGRQIPVERELRLG